MTRLAIALTLVMVACESPAESPEDAALPRRDAAADPGVDAG